MISSLVIWKVRRKFDIALNKLYSVYTFDTACFYTDEENELDKQLQESRFKLSQYKLFYNNRKDLDEEQKSIVDEIHKVINNTKSHLKEVISQNTDTIRTVRNEKLNDKNIVSVFESNLTRSLKMTEDKLNESLVIIKVYYFDVAKSIIKNGFYLNGDKYVFFSASAGQIRTKKFVAVKETLLDEVWNSLTCGLTVEKINSLGGVNKNKYLAYLALCNSATDLWEDFDINKCIVVDDFETNINGLVDYIDKNNYEIERKQMNVPVTHTDGCGMILPCLSKKNFMCRAPWVKGLLASFPFDKFIREANERDRTVNHGIVTDIYGEQYDVLADGIQIIFTKSQFKMWKFFSSWQEYKNNFIEYGCTAGKCNIEDDFVPDAKFNYQMLQTLTDLSDEELETICKRTNEDLKNLSTDKKTMLKVFGATKENSHKNAFQECLMMYPELLQDVYTKNTLREIKHSLEKEGYSGRVEIDGKYLFLIPDLYAFCENLFLHIQEPKGLLDDGEIYSRVYKNKEKLDCLRSPHLGMEHAVRKNVFSEIQECKRWFNTDGIYTSCHDLISKILQFDNDGDKSLVCADNTIIKAAERNCKKVVPLYYEMLKAPAQIITPDELYKGMIAAYTGGNIGEISNDITKIWNSREPNTDAIKYLCMENNFVIDYAKTLYKPIRPEEIDTLIKNSIKGKLPHFFMYAKDKEPHQVKSIKNKKNLSEESCVNRLLGIIHKYKFSFSKSQLGSFDYKMLMNNKDIGISDEVTSVINTYYTLASSASVKMVENDEKDNYNQVFELIKSELLNICPDIYLLTDILVLQLFKVKKAKHKVVFWNCFGDIVLENLCKNLNSNSIMCEKCGKRFIPNAEQQKYCDTCSVYQPIETKTIICKDCGMEFEVDSKDNQTNRCPNCYKEYRRDKIRINVQKYREKQEYVISTI